MKQNSPRIRSYVLILVALAVVIALINLGARWLGDAQTLPVAQVDSGLNSGQNQVPPLDEGATTLSAQVVEIVEEGVIEVNQQPQPYQIVQVRVLEGSWAGQIVTIDYGKLQMAP